MAAVFAQSGLLCRVPSDCIGEAMTGDVAMQRTRNSPRYLDAIMLVCRVNSNDTDLTTSM